jgi:hypothetical protein
VQIVDSLWMKVEKKVRDPKLAQMAVRKFLREAQVGCEKAQCGGRVLMPHCEARKKPTACLNRS